MHFNTNPIVKQGLIVEILNFFSQHLKLKVSFMHPHLLTKFQNIGKVTSLLF